MRSYKVKTYNELEEEIDLYCMIFGIVFCLVYLTILLIGVYVATYYA
jgi:hypothetical protein